MIAFRVTSRSVPYPISKIPFVSYETGLFLEHGGLPESHPLLKMVIEVLRKLPSVCSSSGSKAP